VTGSSSRCPTQRPLSPTERPDRAESSRTNPRLHLRCCKCTASIALIFHPHLVERSSCSQTGPKASPPARQGFFVCPATSCDLIIITALHLSLRHVTSKALASPRPCSSNIVIYLSCSGSPLFNGFAGPSTRIESNVRLQVKPRQPRGPVTTTFQHHRIAGSSAGQLIHRATVSRHA
jgi:hypothetical protein